VYLKSDKRPACGIFLTKPYDFIQAEAECQKLGGRLPEITSQQENSLIDKFRVLSSYQSNLFKKSKIFLKFIIRKKSNGHYQWQWEE